MKISCLLGFHDIESIASGVLFPQVEEQCRVCDYKNSRKCTYDEFLLLHMMRNSASHQTTGTKTTMVNSHTIYYPRKLLRGCWKS